MRARFSGGSMDGKWADVPGATHHLVAPDPPSPRCERYRRTRTIWVNGVRGGTLDYVEYAFMRLERT